MKEVGASSLKETQVQFKNNIWAYSLMSAGAVIYAAISLVKLDLIAFFVFLTFGLSTLYILKKAFPLLVSDLILAKEVKRIEW